MNQKQEPCCARRTGKLTHDQNNLRTLAQRAAALDAKGRDISKYRDRIAESKRAIELDKVSIEEHAADHLRDAEYAEAVAV